MTFLSATPLVSLFLLPKKLHHIFNLLSLLHILNYHAHICTWCDSSLCGEDTVKSIIIKCIIPIWLFCHTRLWTSVKKPLPRRQKNERLNQASKLQQIYLVWWTIHDSPCLIRMATNDPEAGRMAFYLCKSHIAAQKHCLQCRGNYNGGGERQHDGGRKERK